MINDVIIYILVVFLCMGAIDYCMDNRFGLGDKFKEGFMAMGTLTLAMVGIVSLAPLIASVLLPIVGPVYGWIGADPAAFANTILALDMGGYALAQEMGQNQEAALFSWVFLGTMMGPTIVFTIPVALSLIRKEDHDVFAKGILVGMTTIPIGCFVGAVLAGLDITMVIRNLIPTVIFSAFILLGLCKFPTQIMKGFHFFGKAIKVIATIGLSCIIIETLTGHVIIPGMTPVEEGFKIVGMIAMVLAGAFPLVAFVTKVFQTPLSKAGALLRVDAHTTAGLIAALAHAIPMFAMLKNMDERGKIINVAFAVSGAFVFGGHLAFVAGINKEMVFAMIIGKLTSGVTAIILAIVVTSNIASGKESSSRVKGFTV
ncbi:ethanolamine utilization protein EutH [Caldalkalibacillus salinus]|uniref:ethanolamine utilization protein EutH n=1 Tax=Caldalkalibacillus salinus TaxID=2803787 RepID=UPI0019219CF5|nr:ethanolamine utilization protein EutH [Caldalkalibacillus salinus]